MCGADAGVDASIVLWSSTCCSKSPVVVCTVYIARYARAHTELMSSAPLPALAFSIRDSLNLGHACSAHQNPEKNGRKAAEQGSLYYDSMPCSSSRTGPPDQYKYNSENYPARRTMARSIEAGGRTRFILTFLFPIHFPASDRTSSFAMQVEGLASHAAGRRTHLSGGPSNT